MGIYYISPLLGSSLGPVFGGILTTAFSWHAPFWFLAILAGTAFLCFLSLFKDSFWQERSSPSFERMSGRLEKGRNPIATVDIEKHESAPQADSLTLPPIKLILKDIAPIETLWLVIWRWNNLILLLASGILFSYCFTMVYTTSRTLANVYGYDALYTGLMLLFFGLGSIAGSIFGGRSSDHGLAILTTVKGGVLSMNNKIRIFIIFPYMRLSSTLHGLWLSYFRRWVRVGAGATCAHFGGVFAIYIFSSKLTYLVDGSTSAVTYNSLFHKNSAFIAVEIAVPVQ
ncbi:major facilitator superfamily domain-containing protein, partial [Armillaria luteobubalina]